MTSRSQARYGRTCRTFCFEGVWGGCHGGTSSHTWRRSLSDHQDSTPFPERSSPWHPSPVPKSTCFPSDCGCGSRFLRPKVRRDRVSSPQIQPCIYSRSHWSYIGTTQHQRVPVSVTLQDESGVRHHRSGRLGIRHPSRLDRGGGQPTLDHG